MTRLQLLGGLGVTVAYVAPLVAAGWALARRLLGRWPADVRALAAAVLFFVLLTVPAEVLGAFGHFRQVSLLVTYLAIGAVVTPLCLVGQPLRRPRPAPSGWGLSWPDFTELCSLAVIALAVAGFYVRTRLAFADGTLGFDSLNYHLPFAADFYSSGRTLPIPHLSYFLPNAFFPATSETVHAIGMAATKRDVLSPFISLLWLGVALLAGLTAFTTRRARLVSGAAVGVVVLAPGFFTAEAGTALADLPSAAFALAAFVLWRRLDRGLVASVAIGLAMGLAVGCKLTALLAAGLLLIAIVSRSGPGNRVLAVGGYLVGAIVGGGFWFARDAVELHNPVPELNLGIFPRDKLLYDDHAVGKPRRSSVYEPRTVFHYLLHHSDLRVITDALHSSLGVAWPGVLGVVALACLLVLRRAGTPDRALAAICLIGLVGYVVTPESAPSLLGRPLLGPVIVETKILLPWLFLGAVVIAAFAEQSGRIIRWLIGAVLLAQAIFELTPGIVFPRGQWPSTWPHRASGFVVAGVIFVIVVLLLKFGMPRLSFLQQTQAYAGVAIVAVGVLLLGVGGWTTGRYAGLDLARRPAVAAALAPGANLRIGVSAEVPSYVYRGPLLHDDVKVIGDPGPHGAFTAPSSCRQWLSELAAARRNVVVVPIPPNLVVPPLAKWTAEDGHARRVLANQTDVVFVLDGQPSPKSCS